MSPGPDRAMARSRTNRRGNSPPDCFLIRLIPGMAAAMAQQWGDYAALQAVA